MSETFAFELKLVSDIEKVAKRQIEPLRKLEQQADKTKTALSKGFADSWSKIGMAADRAAFKQHQGFAGSWEKIGAAASKAAQKQQASFSNAWAKIGMAADRTQKKEQEHQRRQLEHQKKLEQRAEKAKEKQSFMHGMKEAVGFEKMASAAFVGSFLADSLIEGTKKAVEIFSDGIKEAFKIGAEAETVSLGYRASLGSKEKGEEAEKDASRWSRLIGMQEEQAQRLTLPLLRAGFSEKGARSAVAAAADLSVGRGQGLGGVADILDIERKIRLKGGVSEKMLVGLDLDEREFKKDLAKQTHLSGDEAMKRAQAGKIDPQILLNTFQRSVMRRNHESALGGTALEFGKGMEAQLTLLEDLPSKFIKKIAGAPGWTQLENRFAGILKQLDPDSPVGQKITGNLLSAFNKIAGAMNDWLKPENVDAFGKRIGDVIDDMSKLPGILDKAITASEVLGTIWAGDKIVNGFTSLAEALPGLSSRLGSLVGVAGATGIAIGGVAAAVLGVVEAAREQDQAIEGIIGKYNKAHPVDPEAAKYFGTEYAREHKAVIRHGEMKIGDFGTAPSPYVVSVPPSSSKPSAAGGKVTLHAPVNITINAEAGEDPNHTAQKTGEQVHRHVQAALEKAAQAGGG